MEKKDETNSRRAFLGAGLIVGGALYSDPAAALANVGGRRFGGVSPDTVVFKSNTPISKLVDNVPKNLTTVTLAELSGLADLKENILVQLYAKYNLQVADLQNLLTAVETEYGTGNVLTPAGTNTYMIACCCCSCCCKNVTFSYGA